MSLCLLVAVGRMNKVGCKAVIVNYTISNHLAAISYGNYRLIFDLAYGVILLSLLQSYGMERDINGSTLT